MAISKTIVTAALMLAAGWLSAGARAQDEVFDKKAAAEAEDLAKAVGRKMFYHETPNFTWCASIPTGKLQPIAAAAEKALAHYMEHAKLSDWRPLWGDQKAMGVILANKKDYKRYVHWYAKNNQVWSEQGFIDAHSDANWFTENQARRIFVTHFKPHDEEFVAQICAHLVGHLIANRVYFNRNFVPPWFEESMAIYFETVGTGRMQCGCYRDPYALASNDKERRNGMPVVKLKQAIKAEVAKNRLKKVQALYPLRLNQITADDIYKGYAVVAWMMSQEGQAAKFMRNMKRSWPSAVRFDYDEAHGTAQDKGFEQTFQMTPEAVEAAVAEWVKGGF